MVTPAKDLNFIANFQVLEDLNLYGTEVSSATLFSSLKALRTLVLSGNMVDLEPLSHLQFLQTLRIRNWAPTWPLNDLTPLAQISHFALCILTIRRFQMLARLLAFSSLNTFRSMTLAFVI